MKTKTQQPPVSAIADIVAEIIERTDTTDTYKNKIENIKGPSSCIVKVNATGMGEGYRLLDIIASKETVSYRNEDGTISYRSLTHILQGKTMRFGLYCSPKGTLELFMFLPNSELDCEFLACIRITRHICDPMYALLSEDKLYVVYNVPSTFARNSIASQRVPQIDDDGTSASGYPGIACFNMKDNEQSKLLPPFESMPQYSCGLYFNATSKEPMLCVANIYNQQLTDNERPSLRKLLADIVGDDDDSMRNSVDFPVGVSSVSFVKKTEISQSPLDGDPSNGVVKIILKDSNEDGAYIFSVEDQDEFSDNKQEENDTF